jgi:hypothetical protein
MQMNYDFAQKNHWRNRVWNEIAERVTVHPRDAVVLYLAAEQDLDRAAARRRGFCEHNMIAVDWSGKTVSELRRSGKLAIKGNLYDVALNWPVDVSVDVVIADFVGGLYEKEFRGVGKMVFYPPFHNAVFATNMLRGRENTGKDERYKYGTFISNSDEPEKHRGMLLVKFLMCAISQHWVSARKQIKQFANLDHELAVYEGWQKHVLDSFDPTFGQYESKKEKEDESTDGDKIKRPPTLFNWAIFNTSVLRYKDKTVFERYGTDAKMIQQIAAVLSHRTRRLNAA